MLTCLPSDVALITSLDDTATLDAYFSQFLVPAAQGSPAKDIKLLAPPDWSKVQKVEISHSFAVKEKEPAEEKAAVV